MEQWQDHGIVVSARRHGENGAVVRLLTAERGLSAGYVRGVDGSLRGVLEAGNLVEARWNARNSTDLGSYALDLVTGYPARVMSEAPRLQAMQAACALCDAALPEGEAHGGLFHGTCALFDALEGEAWAAAYILWEIAFLRELGFSLDLTRCASGSEDTDLRYVSPKTGRAVSASAGAVYKDKLLPLPGFLSPAGEGMDDEAIAQGLQLTGYFLEHWAFAQHTKGVPGVRVGLYNFIQG